MKKLTLILLFLLFGSTNSFASQLSLFSFWGFSAPVKANGPQTGVSLYKTILIIQNTGSDECFLPKSNLGPIVIQENGKTTVHFSVSQETTMGGTKVTPSIYEFLPVKLRPGNALIIYYDLMLPANQNIEDVTFHYEISSEVVKEWGFDETSLEAKLKKAPR